jgi:hypothetical protein
MIGIVVVVVTIDVDWSAAGRGGGIRSLGTILIHFDVFFLFFFYACVFY